MNCYVTNPRNNHTIPDGIDKSNTLFYPESGMTTHQCFTTMCPRDYHIFTDSPYLVGLYDRDEVFIWKDGKWVNPDIQTYGCSYNLIAMELFNYFNTIPQAVIDSSKCTNCMGSKI